MMKFPVIWWSLAIVAAFMLGTVSRGSDGNISTAAAGGAERPIVAEDVSFDTVFPVHSDDFVRFTSPYGQRVSPILGIEMDHIGLDIQTVWRARVVVVADGVVVEHWPPPDGYYKGHRIYGGMVRIDHGDYQTVYAHLAESFVATGQELIAGEVIGRVGGTGMVDGEHLHFEVRIDGGPVNPLLYIPSYGNISTGGL